MKCKNFWLWSCRQCCRVSMLTACGGGGGGVSGSLDLNQVDDLLEIAGSDIHVERNNKLDNAVRDAAERIVSTGSTSGADRVVSNAMEWSLNNFVGNAGMIL